ncbi:MAG: MBL fold metallo-hydrolase [Synergistaceae bacterium]|jgi:glyoxylase-like metal-dependent hydrolase (beta-lactamase superfamily II)|nr:MBL fold metallo-hydrolase [Synergistaceae bacterium]
MTGVFDYVYDELPEGLSLFDLPQPKTGFRNFISAWFFIDAAGRRILVDPGPASTIPLLLDKLSGVTDGVDLVILTHIHLDHSGGIGQFCERNKNAVVSAHPKAAKHLIDPGKLWRSSLEVLGDVAEMYGEPSPLDPSRLVECSKLSGVEVFETPGHSPHHISFIAPLGDKRLFFVGEAGGIYYHVASPFGETYLRPATPTKFGGDTAQASIAKIAQAVRGDEIFCYAHWGVSNTPKTMISKAQEQLDEWMSHIFQMREQPEDAIIDSLLSRDELLSGYSSLPQDIRERELIFIGNSVRGILRYFEDVGRDKK